MAAVAEQRKTGRLNARVGGLYRKLFFGATLFSVVVLAVINLMTAFAVVTVTHQTRVQYARLQTLEHERDALQANWSRLLLEESTWSSPSRIEAIAQQRLQMKVPAADATRVLKP
ncbi:cell division protein FtsL [Carnimonas nigrificans]|uniref:cell division protein FtsL n=1 Tax=Carnimonas nigrificans TaxID=64323 RepID=UPI00046F1C5B|nr:cell division protein FtsL [Carnimonas nigrificans]